MYLRIFSVFLYALNTLNKNNDLSHAASEQLKLLQKTAQRSIKELRATIYSLSSIKNNRESFTAEVQNYLSDLEKLNGITVDYEHTGSLI